MQSPFQYLRHFLIGQPNVQLNPRAIHVVEQLEVANWFTNVGQPVSAGKPVLLLASWQEAVESATSPAYDDFVLEPANQLRGSVFRQSSEHFQTWNAVVHVIKQHSEPLVERKIASSLLAPAIGAAISGTVRWDIVHILLALHFQDSYLSPYYENLLNWYLCGRFPCGWHGIYPEGQLIIY